MDWADSPVLIFIATLPVASLPRALYILTRLSGVISLVKYTVAFVVGVCAFVENADNNIKTANVDAEKKVLAFIIIRILKWMLIPVL